MDIKAIEKIYIASIVPEFVRAVRVIKFHDAWIHLSIIMQFLLPAD